MGSSKSGKNSYQSNITWCILKRQQRRLSLEEKRSVLRYAVCQTTHTRRAVSCNFSGSPISTYFLAFSPDGQTVASSHGDHSLRISNLKSGLCLHTLKGHPRSVWCIAFHHTSPNLLASGCLKGVVSIWDLKQNDKLIASLNCDGVTSLTFHPTDMVLLVAMGNQLLLWSWYEPKPLVVAELTSVYEKIRLVKFDSLGHHILTGILDTKPMGTSVDKLDSNTRENPFINQTSVVNINLQNMETTVDHVTEEAVHERVQGLSGSNQNTDLFCLQWWDFTNLKFPDLNERDLNVVACNCKLFNNMSADISADGHLLTALVAKLTKGIELCRQVCVFSLEKENLGQCLFSATLGCNTFSTCFSPLGTHIIVGIACSNGFGLFQEHPQNRTVAYIFELCGEANFLSKRATLKLQASEEGRFSNLRANAVVWHPVIGHGLIAIGTNNGGVYFCHV